MGNRTVKNQMKQSSVVVITGASSGLGRQIALALSKKKLRLVLSGRNEQRLNQTQQLCSAEGQAQVSCFVADVTVLEDCVYQLIKFVQASYNRIDYLFLNAGINAHSTFSQLQNMQIFETLMRTNFYANVALTKLALPFIKKSNGKIIVISSLSGKFGLPSRSAYCASKFALTGFFESLRTEENISIMMVYPTSLDTPMRNNNLLKTEDKSNKDEKRQDPAKCAQMIIDSVERNVEDVYVPFKGYLGVVLQPLFPKFIRQKLKKAAKL